MLAGGSLIVGTIVLAASTTIAQLIAGRIMTGVVRAYVKPERCLYANRQQGMGINCATSPIYLAECCPPKRRGAILSIQGLVGIAGMVLGM